MAEAYGAIIKSVGETVAVVPLGSLERADGEKLPPVTIAYEKESKWSWTLRQRDAYKSVVAFYQDEDSGETKAIINGSGAPELRLNPIHQTKEAAEMAAEAGIALIAVLLPKIWLKIRIQFLFIALYNWRYKTLSYFTRERTHPNGKQHRCRQRRTQYSPVTAP